MKPLPELRKALRFIKLTLTYFVKQSATPCVKTFINKSKDKFMQKGKVGSMPDWSMVEPFP